MAKQLKKSISLLVAGMMLLSLLPTAAFAAEGEPGEAFAYRACEHVTSYVLQDDSYEATDTTGGYRHYACSECGAEYSYETDPMVYEVNPKTGEPLDYSDAVNPYLPNWEFMPDNELHVFWSREDDEWRVYAVGSHDKNLSGWCGDDITCWSAPVYDLSDWRFEAILRDTGRFFACDFNYDLQTDQAVLYAFPFFGNSEMQGTHLWVNGRSVPNAYYDIPFVAGDGVVGLDGVNLFDPSLYIAEDGTILATYDDSTGGTKHAQLAKVNADDRSQVEWTVDVQMAEGEPNSDGFNPKHYEGSTIDRVDVDGYSYWVIQYSYKSNWTEDDYEKDVDGEQRWWPLVYIYSDPDMEIDELKDFTGWHYGGVIGDNGGFYRLDLETGEVVDHADPVFRWGNNHGGLAYINGDWYVSNHRHTSTGAGRQGYIRQVDISVDESGKLVIETPEYTSSIYDSIDGYQAWPTYIACHLWPSIFSEVGAQEMYIETPMRNAVDSETYWNTVYNDPAYGEHMSPIVGITDGGEVGFKYLDFGDEAANVDLSILVNKEEGYVDGSVDVYLDAASEEAGGTKIGTIDLSNAAVEAAEVAATNADGVEWKQLTASMDEAVSGVRGVFFVFRSESEGTICKFDQFDFDPSGEQPVDPGEKNLSVDVSAAATAGQDQRVPYTFSFSGEKENLGNVTVVFNVKGDPAGLFTGGAFETAEGFSKYVLDEEEQADGSRRVKVVLAYGMDELTALEEAALTDELTDLFTYVIRSSAGQEGNIEVTVEQAIFTYAGDNDLYYADVTGATASTSVSAKDPYDIDGDGDFDQADITAAQGYYRAAEGDANWDEARKADVNADGVVDLTDLVELATAWLEVLG